MARFGKKRNTPDPQPVERPSQQALLSSGRMASVFLKLYRWIFSVNISMDAYQLESGTNDSGLFPFRGRYRELIPTLCSGLLPEQRDYFEKTFSANSIKSAAARGATSLSGFFCASFDSETSDPRWYEIRAEWENSCDTGNFVFILYFRHVRDDLDTGRTALPVQAEAGDTVNWTEIRARRLLGNYDAIMFEYNVAEDCMYVHRQSEGGDRITRHFLSTLPSRGDWLISHENIAQVQKLLRSDPGRGAEREEILYRANGAFGAPYQHYRMTAVPLEEDGDPTWILGMLENIEELTKQRRQNDEILFELSKILELNHIELFELRCESNQIFKIVQGQHGFMLEEKPHNLSEYVQKRIKNGAIAPESASYYLDWLSPGVMNKHAGNSYWEFESRCKEPGGTQYRWYSESIFPLGKMPGRYLRWRSDITDAHAAREKSYELKEMTHLAEYNGSVLDSLAGLVEFRSVESSDHVRRVREVTRILLSDLARRSPQYELSPQQVSHYVQASTLHDIGKIVVPDNILNKTGQYTPDEYEKMKLHTIYGEMIIDRLEMAGQDELKSVVRDVVRHHHERFDGKGYPDALKGDEVPVGVQVVSLADVYDALVSERCYKNSFPADEAEQMILSGECGSFNPCLLETLKACRNQLNDLYVKGQSND